MTKHFSTLLIGLSLVALSGCFGIQEPTDETPPEQTESSSSVQETKNVIYRGTVQEVGASIFMQGTHQLQLEDGRSILLESDDIDLDDYLTQNVEVFGAVRPTVEAGGLIMRVQSITSLDAPSSSSSSSESSNSPDASASSSSVSSAAASSVASSVSSSVTVSSVSSSSAAISSAPAATSSVAWEGSAELSAKADAMAKANMDIGNWTQQYCSSHIGYCIPVHKSWWFKSFGTTSSAFWHVEIGPSEMNNIGEGPITVKLVSGNTNQDGQVRAEGEVATGIRSWTGNRHFEIRGPASLEKAIRTITEQLKPSSN